MARILVIEDEEDMRRVLDYNLRQAGHEVFEAATGQEGLQVARTTTPDLVLLDLMLPDVPGTEVCRALRDDPELADLPIIMLTARTDEVDRVIGFELGADDYVAKPFSVRELLLRIQAILRRPRAAAPSGAIAFGRLRIERQAHRVWVDGREVELTAIELKLLLTLYDRRDRVQSRAALLADVWQTEGEIVTRTVDTHVKRLREKLGPARDYIETVRGTGYRFAARPEDATET